MISRMPFGRTGHISTRTIFGAAALAGVGQTNADRTLDVLRQYSVNHIDTAASYGDSEERIGPWMQRHRADFFLATKVEERGYKLAWDSIRRSLKRMRVEQVDLLQLHNVSDQDAWDAVMAPDGALKAVLEAQRQGLTRFIGITGHDTQIARLHLAALDRADFDSVLLPYSYTLMQNPQYAADFEALVQVCRERNIAVQTIKSLTRRPWGEQTQTHSTWYEPLTDQASIDDAVHWVLARPHIFLNTVGDITLLPQVLDAASRFEVSSSADRMPATATAMAMAPLFA